MIAMTLGCQMEATEKPTIKGKIGTGAIACKPKTYAYLLGQDSSVLDNIKFPNRTRILRPGQAMTMDYFEGRLNIFINGSGKVERIFCG